MSDARTILATADALLGLALVISSVSVRVERTRPLGLPLLWAGFALLSAGLYARGVERAALPVGNVFELLHALAWGGVAADILLRLASSVRLPAAPVAALATALGCIAFLNAGFDGATTGAVGANPWVGFHVGAIVLAFSLFAALAMNSAAYLIQDRALTGHHPGALSRILPSLRQLDRVGTQLLGVGVGLLTLALAVGFAGISGTDAAGATWAKLLAAAGVWVGYGLMYALRATGRVGARGFARAGVALFLLSLLSLWPANAARKPTTPVSTGVQGARP